MDYIIIGLCFVIRADRLRYFAGEKDMKNRFKLLGALFCLMLCNAAACGPAEAVRVSVLSPSVDEQVFESGRDFYVIGRLDREGVSAAEQPLDIRVEMAIAGLVRDGIKIPVRTIQSRVDRKTGLTPELDINFRYKGKAPWVDIPREKLMKFPPPDLVYHHGDPDSFYDPSVKAVVTEDSFAVLIQGGCTKDFDTDYGKAGTGDLEWNLYRVFTTVLSGDEVLAENEMDVMFGTVQEKMLARFSPAKHIKKVEEFAARHGYRVYKDPFPGYWPVSPDLAYEIPVRWRMNDAMEYVEGRVHAVMYNIRETCCAAQDVELGRIAFEGWLDSDEMIYYYYDIGEPELEYEKWSGMAHKEGRIVPFEYGDRVALTRAELGSGRDKYYPDESAGCVDWDVYDSVSTDRGKRLTLYGVVTPIQPMLSEVTPNDDGTFTIGNRIDKIRYVFEDMIDGVLLTEERPVFLTRNYRSDGTEWSADSIYEFCHNFDIPEAMYGRIVTVHVSALDQKGKEVDGSKEDFYLRVR